MVSGIIVAAGRGIRMNKKVRKQYLHLDGRPILCHTLKTLESCPLMDRLYLVVPEEDFDYCRNHVLIPECLDKKTTLVPGGPERQDSVYNGISALDEADSESIVVIHDGVRPFVAPDSIAACIHEAEASGACVLGVPVSDTVKHVSPSGYIRETLERGVLWLAQTPQAFRYGIIREAHEAAKRNGYTGTDDALLVERIGQKVKMVTGNRFNLKITTPEDLVIAGAILRLEGV